MKTRITSNINAAAFCMALLYAVVIPAHAATITVTNTNDSGPGSLRQALADANDGDTINFAVTGTIGLISGELLVDKSVTISGPGANNLAVDGSANSRVFYIGSDRIVSISGLTITNGMPSGFLPGGGGLYNDQATLTLSNCAISNNSANTGGGIYNDGFESSATLLISNCALTSNSARFGGGIYNDGFDGGVAVLTINNSVLSDNSGGGVFNDAFAGFAWLTLNDSTLSGNSANFGGGIYNSGLMGFAPLTLNNSTFTGNRALVQGGGIYNDHGALTLDSSMISGNSAQTQGGGIYNDGSQEGIATLISSSSTLNGNSAPTGGGIFNDAEQDGAATLELSNSTLNGNTAEYGGGIASDGYYAYYVTVQISHSTFSGNSASEAGGSIYSLGEGGDATVNLASTILTAATGGNIFNDLGMITSSGYNLSSDNGGGFLTGPGDQINTDPLLGPLQDNGGPTLTHALLPASPAIDAGDPDFTPPPDYDQRGPGFPRVVNGRIDIGSFEVQTQTVVIQLQASGRRVRGILTVDLSWNGATSTDIDVFRDGTLIVTVPNTGSYTDSIGVRRGNVRYTYKVCEAGTSTCSNEVTVRFGGPPIR
jgi:hypothetical protein